MPTELLGRGPRDLATPYRRGAAVGFVVGGALIVWSSYIHFHLWQRVGYRHIPTIGPLFLLQSIAGLAVGLLVASVHRFWSAALGIGFVLSTLAGFLISVEHGLFGFKDAWSSPFAHQALLVEIATIVVLGIDATACLLGPRAAARSDTVPRSGGVDAETGFIARSEG